MLCLRKPFSSSARASARRSSSSALLAVPHGLHRAAQRVTQQHRSGVAARSIPVSGPSGAATPAPQDAAAEGGVISAVLMDTMRQKIGEALETDQVSVTDAYGDGRHVSIDVVSKLFDGKGAVARQRMVYKAIWYELSSAVHAVDAMTTKTPEEAAR